MQILIDYDNLEYATKRLGILSIASRCINLAFQSTLKQFSRARLKIYGGWYEDKTITQRAQDLAAEILRDFPTVTSAGESVSSLFPVMTNVELAYSMEVNPAKHLFHTYRRQNPPRDIKCYSPQQIGCLDANCKMNSFYSIIKSKKCPTANCNKTIFDYLYKGSQKLVDSMLVADIIHHANNGAKELCIVSSDDDFWPAIESALIAGCSVIHIHTKMNCTTKQDYCTSISGDYTQCNLHL